MSESTRSQNNDVSQFGREDSIVSGRQSSLGATKTLHTLSQSSAQFDDTAPASERHNSRKITERNSDNKQSVIKAGHRAPDSARSTQRPPSASGQRPPSASGHRRRAVRHNVSDSYVDESLFGPVADDTFLSSWQPKQRPVKPFIFDCTDYKAKSSNANSSNNVPSSRPPSQRSARSRPRSARLQTQPTFVDESLFGAQLEPSTWRAPWDKKDSRPKPIIFDASDYREKQRRNSISGTQTNRGSTKQLPPWR